MTCVAAAIDKDGGIVMGADTYGGDGKWVQAEQIDPKVFVRSHMIVGFTTSWRMGQILRYEWEPPRPSGDDREHLHGFVVKQCIPGIRKAFAEHGWMGEERDEKRESGGAFMIGLHGCLFLIEEDFSVSQYASYFAIGSGRDHALGALYATENEPAEQRVRIALAASNRHTPGVGPAQVIVRTKVCS
jgi:hypothetical protein